MNTSDDKLVADAKLRAVLLRLLSKQPLTQRQLEDDQSVAAELGVVKLPNLYPHLRHLADNGFLVVTTAGNKNVYSTPSQAEGQTESSDTTETHSKRRPSSKDIIKVDLVKSTGKVRIQLQGIVLEVGVVD